MDFAKLHRNFTELIDELEEIVLDSAMEKEETIAELNRNQLWEGQDSDGNPIRPSYSEDSYFKTPEAAARYAAWKQRITPSSRDSDTPNLYINGAYYRSIKTKRKGKTITTVSDSQLGSKIKSKFKNISGLNPKSIEKMKPDMLERMLKRSRQILHKE